MVAVSTGALSTGAIVGTVSTTVGGGSVSTGAGATGTWATGAGAGAGAALGAGAVARTGARVTVRVAVVRVERVVVRAAGYGAGVGVTRATGAGVGAGVAVTGGGVGVTTTGGGATITGGGTVAVSCANTGAMGKARAANSAAVTGRSWEGFCFISRRQRFRGAKGSAYRLICVRRWGVSGETKTAAVRTLGLRTAAGSRARI